MHKFLFLAGLFCAASTFASAEEPKKQPPVSRRTIVCDQWRWIGGSTGSWGCASAPREAFVAGGAVTDQVIHSLQEQINKLEARIKELEAHKE